MRTADVCKPNVVTTARGASLTEAAKLMRENHVGSVIVVDELKPEIPVGIVTDRDIVIEVVAAGLDHRGMTVGEIMTTPLVTAHGDDDALETLRAMRIRGVRRLPVVDDAGLLMGIASLDDLIEIAGDALNDVVGAIASERSLESWRRR